MGRILSLAELRRCQIDRSLVLVCIEEMTSISSM